MALLILAAPRIAAENLSYRMYMTVAGISVNAGSCRISDSQTSWNGTPAKKVEMAMSTGKGASAFYDVSDTITSYMDRSGRSLFYRKAVNENSKHNIETAEFTYGNGSCSAHLLVRSSGRLVYDKKEEWDCQIFDMLSMMNYTRGLDATGKQSGYTIELPMVNGELVVLQHIVYKGHELVKTATGEKVACIKLSVRDYKYGSERETLVIYVTDDSKHVPVRLDLKLNNSCFLKVLLQDRLI